MATQGVSAAERILRKGLLPVCVIAGAAVIAGFFFPQFVGDVVTGQGWLVLALLFFGAGLGYIALLPVETGEPEENRIERGATYLLRVRRLTWIDSVKHFLSRQDPLTFGAPVLVLAVFFAAFLILPEGTVAATNAVRDFLLRELGLLFLGVMFLSVLYCLFLLVGPWGDVRLGGSDAEPTYTYPTYFSMVFTAGIAAGIVFWGPAEAIFHYQSPPPYFGADPQSGGAILFGLTYALFHWGFSAWSAYTVIGVPIAYFMYQRGAPLRVSTVLTPFLGVDGLDSLPGRIVDTLAIFATIGGIATSVAFVSRQFLTGINFQWGVTYGDLGPVLFVGMLTLIYVLSAASGVHRGIRRIAAVNVVLFGLFALLLVAVGPRSFVLDRGMAALGNYAAHFVQMSFYTGGEWVAGWTVWNWSWWFSWAPFAGLFLAALSRGRTVRTVVLTGVVATSGATIVWFLLMGGTSLYLQHTGAADILASISAYGGSEAVAGFPMFAALPFSQLLMFLFLALIVVFIVTSADTSTLVVSILATKRELAPSTGSLVFWGIFQGTVAVTVLLIGGGETLQAVAVLTGGPFAVISLVALLGLTVSFRRNERGHSSLPGKLWRRLPTVETPDRLDTGPGKDD